MNPFCWVKEKALAEGRDLETAVALADQAVIDSQGSGHIKDLAGVQRGNPVKKLFTNFMSYFQTTYNLTIDAKDRFVKTPLSPQSLGRLGVDMFLLYTAPIVMTWLFREAFLKALPVAIVMILALVLGLLPLYVLLGLL